LSHCELGLFTCRIQYVITAYVRFTGKVIGV